MKTEDITTIRIANFWLSVKKTESCWLWTGYTNEDGYGKTSFNGKQCCAHRLAYFLIYGEFDELKQVCHTCDNPPCVNPDHLFLGTAKDNITDCLEKGRNFLARRLNCKKGHEYTGSNFKINKKGFRECLICRRIYTKEWNKKNPSYAKEYLARRKNNENSLQQS